MDEQEVAGEPLQRQLRKQPFTGHQRNLLSLMLSFTVPLTLTPFSEAVP